MTERRLLIYIAGGVTGIPSFRANFAEAAEEVQLLGHTPISPLEVCAGEGLREGIDSWRSFMIADIRALLACDGIYMLRMWWDSKGARLEHTIAEALGLELIYQPEEHQ